MQSRNRAPSRPAQKPMRSRWSNTNWQSKQRPLWLSWMMPLARMKELPRRLPRRPRKAQLLLTHQTLNCMLTTRRTLGRPKKPQRPSRTRRNPLQRRCSSSTQTCCLWMLSMRGTRLSRSRQKPTLTSIYKACPRKALGDLCASHLMTAWCFTFSQCFPTMQLSKRSTTFLACSSSPSIFACISLYSA